MVGKILVHRRRHHRKGFQRKGKYILPTSVKPSTFLTKDKGKKGRTPLKKRWSKKVKFDKMPGYEIEKSAEDRLSALRKNIKAEGGGCKGKLSTARTLQAIVNVNPSKKSDRIMKSDIKKVYPKWGKK